MQIDITAISDDLGGNWWNHVRAADLGFTTKIPGLSSHEVGEGDILIHKEIQEGERFPQIRYHAIKGGRAVQLDNKEIKAILAEKMLEFAKKNNRLPFACKFDKVFKNGSVQVKYTPTSFDSFALKVQPGEQGVANPAALLQGLKPIEANPIGGAKAPQKGSTGPKHQVDPEVTAIASKNSGKVYIAGSEVVSLEERKATFQDHETTYFLAWLKGGTVAVDDKKSTAAVPFQHALARFSDTLVEKSGVKAGSRASFKGSIKQDKHLGPVIQNIRSIK